MLLLSGWFFWSRLASLTSDRALLLYTHEVCDDQIEDDGIVHKYGRQAGCLFSFKHLMVQQDIWSLFICWHSRESVRTAFPVPACATSEMPTGQRSHTNTDVWRYNRRAGMGAGRS